MLALTTAVAVCDAARPLAPRPAWGIKWPNDLFAAGRKIAGVLVEAPNLPGLARRRAVIGVGLNVNNSMALAPAQLRSTGVALCDLTHQSHDLVRLLADVLGSIERRLAQLGDEDPRLAIAWRELCILRGRAVRVAPPEPATVGDSAQSEVMDGICHGIDDDGSLLVQGADGRRRIVAGRVTIME